MFRIKIFLAIISAAVLLILAKLISGSYYKQPIFLALMAGSIYIIFTSMQSFYASISQSNNDFKSPLIKEAFLQISKIILIPFAVLYIKNFRLPDSSSILVIFSVLAIISLLSMALMHFLSVKSLGLKKVMASKLKKTEISDVRRFIFDIALITSSVMLFGNIDKIIIGPFVPPEFVGYYAAAFSLVNASAFLLVFSDVFFPIFVRIKGKKLSSAFDKSVAVTLLMSAALFLFLVVFSGPLIKIIFGQNYSASVNMLRALALLALFFPLIELYTSYIISRGNLDKIKKVVFFILVISVILPLLFVKFMSDYGNTETVFGLIFGVLISKAVHLFCLVRISRKV